MDIKNFYVYFFLVLWVDANSQYVTFPRSPKFLFGTATSSYQIEGAWNASGKGEHIWDRYTHEHPERILDGSNGDIACDSYNKYLEDIKILKELGVDFYRFSLSWSRILPTGRGYKVNPDGIRYYNAVIDNLLKNGITPMVTIFHWDTPQPLQDLGGFANERMADWFEEYARVVFESFGDRVKLWVTFNEPKQTCIEGYGLGSKAPGFRLSGVGDYICTHNLLKAHARAWHLYDNEYRRKQKGKVGITIDMGWGESVTSSPEDVQAAERMQLFLTGLYADPIFSKHGDYPEVVKEIVRSRSLKEGFKQSRLPTFKKEEVKYIQGTYDFYGMNYYTNLLIQNVPNAPHGDPALIKDLSVKYCQDPAWPVTASPWFTVEPCGFEKSLRWLKDRYHHDKDLEIYVTENGYSDYGELNDTLRIEYFRGALTALNNAMKHGVNIKAYAIWSLLDNFEWTDGYSHRFGIYHVDFQDVNRKRTPKASVDFLKDVIVNRKMKADERILGSCKMIKTINKCP